MDILTYYGRHERECEVAFFHAAPDRPVTLPALVYTAVHGLRGELRGMLNRAPPSVRARFERMLRTSHLGARS